MDPSNPVMKKGTGVVCLLDAVVVQQMIAIPYQYCSGSKKTSIKLTQHLTSWTLTPLESRRSANLICFKVSIVFG